MNNEVKKPVDNETYEVDGVTLTFNSIVEHSGGCVTVNPRLINCVANDGETYAEVHVSAQVYADHRDAVIQIVINRFRDCKKHLLAEKQEMEIATETPTPTAEEQARRRTQQVKQWEKIKWLYATIEHIDNRDNRVVTARRVWREVHKRRSDITLYDVVGVLDNLRAQGQLVSAHEPVRLALLDLDAGFTLAASVGRRTSALRAGNLR